jgi:hypothetical protein
MKYYTLYDWSSHLEMVLNGNTLCLQERIHIQHEARCEITYYSAGNNRFVFMTSFLAMLRHREGHRLSGDP